MSILDEKIRFIKKVFGATEFSRDGKNIAIKCPSEKCRGSGKKKLAIRVSDDRINCWVCGMRGKLIKVLKMYRSQQHIHEYITKFSSQNFSTLIDEQEVEKQLQMPEGYRMLAIRSNSVDPRIQRAITYLKRRGLTERDLWYFKFGISSDPDLKDRVIMLSYSSEGSLNFYTARSLEKKPFRKYMNCDQQKKAIIFNEINIDWSKELTLVEGPFDLTKCDDNATTLLGSSLAEDSRLFFQIYKHKTPIILALDSDMQEKEWQRIAKLLSLYDIPVKILDLKKFDDVGSMTKKDFLCAKECAVPWTRDVALLKKIQGMKPRRFLSN